jgi:hypothetical protein
MTKTKITRHALFFAALCLICSCGSNESVKSADKSRLETSKYDFSHDPDLKTVNAHIAEAQVKETQKAVLNLKHMLNLMGDHAYDTTGDSLYKGPRYDLSPAARLVSAKVALALNLHLLNQLKRRFASNLGLNIVGNYGNPLSIDSTTAIPLQEAYAAVAIVQELEYSNQIDSLYATTLVRRIQQPKLPPVPKIIRKLFGR